MSGKEIYSNDTNWKLSRENFLKTLVLSGVALELPWLVGCESSSPIDFDTSPLSKEKYRTLSSVQEILFPSDDNGPGSQDINAGRYFLWVMNDPLYDVEIKKILQDNQTKFENVCEEANSVRFHELDQKSQESFLAEMIDKDSGIRTWCSRLLSLIFEALLLDPMYGGNTNKAGWDWLNHNPGQPRPNNSIRYPEILKKHEV